MEYTQEKVDNKVLQYFYEENLAKYLTDNEKENLVFKYQYTDPNFAVDPCNKDPYPIDIYDIVRLHKLVRKRKVFTVLEFGLGYSTLIIADALLKNKKEYESLVEKPHIRCNNKFTIHSVDTEKYWIDKLCEKISSFPEIQDLINITYSECEISQFNGRICSFYKKIPDIVPDFIYLDGPSASSVRGDVNGITFNCIDRTVMSGDLLMMEPFFIPGLYILVDGRKNNSYFLKNNFQRNYEYYHSNEYDITTFELIDEPLGTYNINKLDYCNSKYNS